MSSEARKTLLEQIRAVAAAQVDPGAFLQSLQADIEELPGAYVSFATRDVARLEGLSYFDGRPEMTAADKQAALFNASTDYAEGYASEDAITYEIERVLDEDYPREDLEP
ncbi:hypothetical protein [Defluviimonas salinarum]|uniref:Uncharacterized protein n=1 Tax=Defluviimonas salinarum TaxID=2992147 RepID=A0ABT3J917_9RHOB|nr:hypothetical protein [Defluviimonas salinarum]MCW3783879.1 hypothetical protein [Defluviimonas salinarum]